MVIPWTYLIYLKMKKTLSKIKNKQGKRFEQKNDERVIQTLNVETLESGRPNLDINDRLLPQERGKFPNNKIKTDSSRNTDITEKSTTTTYEAHTTSTSESEPARKSNNKKNTKGNYNQRDKTYTDTDPEICITIPDGGRGNIRIVGNNNSGSDKFLSKQVDFASLDEVYGTSPEDSSDDDEDNVQLSVKHPSVYRAEDKENNVIVKGMNGSHGPLRGQDFTTDNEENSSSAGQVNDLENSKRENKKRNKAEQSVKKTGVQPTLTLPPIFSVNIRTSQEEVSSDAPNNKNVPGVRKPSSQLSKLKRHVIGSEYSVVRNSERRTRNEVPLRNSIESSEQKTPVKIVKNIGKNNEYEIFYIDDKCTDTEELRNVFEKLMSISDQGNDFGNSNSCKTDENVQSRRKQKSIDPKNESSDSEITRPMIYVATLDSNNISALEREPKVETKDENKENILKTTSKSIGRTLSSNKICVSKIGIKKSRRSFLKSSFPKVSSRKRSSVLVNKNDKNVLGNISGLSKTYIIRDVMVIPEEKVDQQTANIYAVKPLDYDIPEETVMLEEREIRLHNMNNAYETDPNVSSSSSKKEPSRNPSIPCLYSSSTSTLIDPESMAKNNYVVNLMVDSRNNQTLQVSDKTITARNNQTLQVSDKTVTARNNNIQEHSEIIRDKKVATNYGGGSSTILIGSEAHKEIMEAINASSSKTSIITLSSKISLKGSTGKRLLLSVKRPKGTDSFRKRRSVVETITEENTPVESNKHFYNQNIRIVSTDVIDKNDKSERFEIRRRDNKIPSESETNIINPFTGENNRENTTSILAYPSVIKNTPTPYENNKNFGNNNKYSHTKKQGSKLMVTKSFSEPLILDDSQNDPNVPGSNIIDSNKKKVSGRKRRRIKKQNLSIPRSPETMVYLGAIPNTEYNVFFAPEQRSNTGDDEIGGKKVKSETKTLAPIKSEKLIAQGPKAILIFVNKKTELNRNPFDGNVMYDDDDDSKRYKGKDRGKGKDRDRDRDRGKYGKDKGKHRGSESETSSRGKRGKGKGKGRGGEFDVDSNIYGGSGSRYGGDDVVVEKSPSGNKTVTKYPCGCMKISKYNPEDETSTDEITSAFCKLGSQCEISQSQTDKRRIKYGFGSTSLRESPSKGRGMPRSPQLDIVIEGLMSKKPINPQPPAPQMNGTNLTGTLTIKTNRCNGVLNFYIDPRVKDYLCKNLPCVQNYNDSCSYSNRSRRYS